MAPSPYLFDPRGPQRFLLRSSYDRSGLSHSYRVDRINLADQFSAPADVNEVLRTRYNEVPLVFHAKMRPVVIVSQPIKAWRDRGRHSDESFSVIPVYSFDGSGKSRSYSPEFIEQVKAYVFPQYFYLPESRDCAVGKGGLREGFLRLDLINPIAAHPNWLQPTRCGLSDVAMELLHDWLRVYHGEDLAYVNEILFIYREEAIDSLKRQDLL